MIKRGVTKGEGRDNGVKLLFSKERSLLVRDTALIRHTAAVDKHDHRGQSVNSNRLVGTSKCAKLEKKIILLYCQEARHFYIKTIKLFRFRVPGK